MIRVLLLLLMTANSSGAWMLNEQCELSRETPNGTVTVSPITSGILLNLPEGLVANDTSVRVGAGSKSWRVRIVGGAVELEGGAKPFLEKNWMTVHADGKQVLGFNLSGSSTAWEKLEDCEPALASGGWVPLSGEIMASTDDQIIRAIRRQRPEGLLLDSAGGLAEEAQRIGDAVRKAGMATKVEASGQCFSECTFVLAAGTPRMIEAGGRVGIPASLITEGLGELPSGPRPIENCAAYFNRMGVKGGKIAVLATAASKDELRVFTPTELRDLGFVDTSTPESATATIARRFSKTGAGEWWALASILGVGVIGWGLSRFSQKRSM